jgi:hypothetical protein
MLKFCVWLIVGFVVIIALAHEHSSSPAPPPQVLSTNAADWPFNNAAFVDYAKCISEKIQSEPVKWQYAPQHLEAFADYFNKKCAAYFNEWLSVDDVCRNDYDKCIAYSNTASIFSLAAIRDGSR